ncbi:hypothetical protein NEPTK9_000001 [Candidatus Neptunochlamydia vexilliferae]|uniref:Uncharacterized protein n=1 Tax=Candidatus Neptunichlamydia vexilliferae TaxID=1651774 RepID=A0ABS0AYE7_9BACT|nr:hypothetical protein [Candidatus Neptunochlamydia vexilliferae]
MGIKNEKRLLSPLFCDCSICPWGAHGFWHLIGRGDRSKFGGKHPPCSYQAADLWLSRGYFCSSHLSLRIPENFSPFPLPFLWTDSPSHPRFCTGDWPPIKWGPPVDLFWLDLFSTLRVYEGNCPPLLYSPISERREDDLEAVLPHCGADCSSPLPYPHRT